MISCRCCGETIGAPFLDFGEMPFANRLIKREALDEPEPTALLAIALCPQCKIVQTTFTVDPKILFQKYFYRSSYSDTMLAHSKSLTQDLIVKNKLNSNSLVVEVASNDGYLLKNYVSAGIPVLGIDPAANIAAIAEKENNVPTLVEFFNSTLAEKLADAGKQADVIHAHNVLAHVPDPNELMQGFAELLKIEGEIVIEVPYVGDLIEKLGFDTIYHEHYSYFSLISLERLAQKNGFVIKNVEHLNIHAGSLRIYLGHKGTEQNSSVKEILTEEHSLGIGDAPFYELFASKVKAFRGELRDLLYQLKAEGKSIAAYGASAKGATLLNYSKIGAEIIDFVADRNPLKQRFHLPGSHIPIVSPDKILNLNPDFILLLTWNFADEILLQQHGYRNDGGRFIIPLPNLRIV